MQTLHNKTVGQLRDMLRALEGQMDACDESGDYKAYADAQLRYREIEAELNTRGLDVAPGLSD